MAEKYIPDPELEAKLAEKMKDKLASYEQLVKRDGSILDPAHFKIIADAQAAIRYHIQKEAPELDKDRQGKVLQDMLGLAVTRSNVQKLRDNSDALDASSGLSTEAAIVGVTSADVLTTTTKAVFSRVDTVQAVVERGYEAATFEKLHKHQADLAKVDAAVDESAAKLGIAPDSSKGKMIKYDIQSFVSSEGTKSYVSGDLVSPPASPPAPASTKDKSI